MTTPSSSTRSLLVMLSILLGVVGGFAGYLLWPSTDERAIPELTGYSNPYAGSSAGTTPALPTTLPSASPTTTTPKPKPRTTTRAAPPTTTTPAERKDPRPRGKVGQVVDLVNAERASAGCAPIKPDARLTTAAQRHTDDMSARAYLSHTSPEGVSFDQRIKQAGHPEPAAENIAMGPKDANEVMAAWMDSPGHRANILNCEIAAIGVGFNSGGWYWTQTFGY